MEELTSILKILPSQRQTALFSATQTTKVKDLERMALKQPLYINVDEHETAATVSTLEQGYIVVDSDMRFNLLFTYLKRNLKKKVIVFCSSCDLVEFFGHLFNYIDIPVLTLHGRQKQQKRSSTYFEFLNAASGILIATDVAARGLDMPVDIVVQYDPPDQPREYLHRSGRTARAGKSGKALLFLLPSELGFLRFLKVAKVPLNEYQFPKNKIADIQKQLESLISKNHYLNTSARQAFKSYLQAYQSHSLKGVYDVNKLDLLKVAKSYGFATPPKVSIKAGSMKPKKRDNIDDEEEPVLTGKAYYRKKGRLT